MRPARIDTSASHEKQICDNDFTNVDELTSLLGMSFLSFSDPAETSRAPGDETRDNAPSIMLGCRYALVLLLLPDY